MKGKKKERKEVVYLVKEENRNFGTRVLHKCVVTGEGQSEERPRRKKNKLEISNDSGHGLGPEGTEILEM